VRIATFLLASLLAFGSLPAASAPPPALGEIHGRVVWVDFWASWCAPCRRSFPWMNRMYHKYSRQGLQIIAVNLDSDRKAADRFLRETPADFAVKFDPDGKLATEFDVQAMPSSYLLDASGNVLQRHFGFKLANTQEYEAQIEKALAEKDE
jgi:thiol-disulfide isomerase/thioredoxin